MKASLKPNQIVRIYTTREQPHVVALLRTQGIPRDLAGRAVRISTVGDLGVSFYQVGVDSSVEEPKEWHLFYTRVPGVFNMATVLTPAA